jgi:hypothetical protein
MQDNTYTYLSLSRLYDATLGLGECWMQNVEYCAHN